MNINTFFFLAAAICFALGTFGVQARISWVPAGLFFLTCALGFS